MTDQLTSSSVEIMCTGSDKNFLSKFRLAVDACKHAPIAAQIISQWHDLPINMHATLQPGILTVGFISLSILQNKN